MRIFRNIGLPLVFSSALASGAPREAADPPGVWWDLRFRPYHSTLAPAPRWEGMEKWQESMSRTSFERALRLVYASEAGGWEPWIGIGEDHAAIRMRAGQPGEDPFVLRFADEDAGHPARYWREAASFPPAPPGRPLDGVRIALDPGHLGGRWARMEHRFFQVDGNKPVQEGDMVLQTAFLLRDRLEAFGAEVLLLREDDEPVTRLRPDDLVPYAREMLRHAGHRRPPAAAVERLAIRTFVVNAEIRARAARVNEEWKPDLAMSLHFNAEAWGSDDHPVFSDFNHLHVIVHGSVLPEEWANDDERFDTLARLLQRTHETEVALGMRVADALAEATGMQPFLYRGPNARAVSDSPFLWGRNLLANRIFQCPVLFLEPHVMNHALTHDRVMAGAYEGKRKFGGWQRPNLYDEYAKAVAEATAEWFGEQRGWKTDGD